MTFFKESVEPSVTNFTLNPYVTKCSSQNKPAVRPCAENKNTGHMHYRKLTITTHE